MNAFSNAYYYYLIQLLPSWTFFFLTTFVIIGFYVVVIVIGFYVVVIGLMECRRSHVVAARRSRPPAGCRHPISLIYRDGAEISFNWSTICIMITKNDPGKYDNFVPNGHLYYNSVRFS